MDVYDETAEVDAADEEAGAEDESDLTGESLSEFDKAVVTATDWTTETLVGQLERGNIELNPSFQRRDAWAKSNRKSLFIESIFLGLPIPQITLAERRHERGSFFVIDGKQRLLALRQFASLPSDDFDTLALSGLEVRRDLEGKTLDQLRNDPSFLRDVRAFENETIRTVIVRSWPSEKFLYRVFLRLNTGTLPLSPQELRQALHPGPFVSFADEFSLGSVGVRRALRLKDPDFRMRDVEIVVRFFAFDRYLAEYQGDLKAFLDRTCKQLNQEWSDVEDDVRKTGQALEESIAATFDVFGGDAFRRWNGTNYERSFNRAVFDCMTFYFKHDAVARKAKSRMKRVRSAFEQLCTDDGEFQQAIIVTTKTIGATNIRLDRWGQALGNAIGQDLSPMMLRAFRHSPTG